MDIRDMASDLSSRAGGAISGLKDRFSGNSRNNYDDGYDEYGYDEYGYDDSYQDSGYSPYDNPYDEYSYDYERDAPESGRSRSGSRVSYPSLVSADDIKASTQATERARREGTTERSRSSYSSNRVSVGYADSPEDLPRTEAGRSRGYDSLFTPSSSATVSSSTPLEEVAVSSRPAGYASTTVTPSQAYVAQAREGQSPASVASAATTASAASAATASSTASASSFDPYAAYQGQGVSSYTSTRSLKVIAPKVYGEVENVSRSLKAGDVVVLKLSATDGDLSKRILDFSFGVASALDARVDCIADKVFVIAKGAALSNDETEKLKTMGVLK